MARLPSASCMAFVCCIARCTVIAACMPCGVPCGTSSAAPPRQVRAACRATFVLLPPRCMYAVRPLYLCCMPVVCMRYARCIHVVCPLYVCGTPVVCMLYARCMYAVRLYVCCMPVVCMRCACRTAATASGSGARSIARTRPRGQTRCRRSARCSPQPAPTAQSRCRCGSGEPRPGADESRAEPAVPRPVVRAERACSRAARNATCRIEHGTRAQRPGTPAAFVSRMPRREQAHT
jgi:hypothetical protein